MMNQMWSLRMCFSSIFINYSKNVYPSNGLTCPMYWVLLFLNVGHKKGPNKKIIDQVITPVNTCFIRGFHHKNDRVFMHFEKLPILKCTSIDYLNEPRTLTNSFELVIPIKYYIPSVLRVVYINIKSTLL